MTSSSTKSIHPRNKTCYTLYETAMVRRHVIVKGRVQGVFFRMNTREQALASGVMGWAKNTFSGSVEAVFEGEEQAVERLIRWCRSGPPGAVVRRVDIRDEPYTGEYSSFTIRYSSS